MNGLEQRQFYQNGKTGFIGFILALKNSINLFEYLITYKLSQDHIETTFSAIHGRDGFIDNPTRRQYQAAYKRILVHNQLTGSNFRNCSILDGTQILPVSTKLSNGKKVMEMQIYHLIGFLIEY